MAETVADQYTSVRHTAPGGGEHAPYRIEQRGSKWVVVNDLGEVKGTHDSEEEARQHQKALYANVPGARESARSLDDEIIEAVALLDGKVADSVTTYPRDTQPADSTWEEGRADGEQDAKAGLSADVTRHNYRGFAWESYEGGYYAGYDNSVTAAKTADFGQPTDKPANKPQGGPVDHIDAARQVLQTGQHQTVDGATLDTQSAHAITTLHDALSPENQQKYQAMPLTQKADLAWKLLSGGQQATAVIEPDSDGSLVCIGCGNHYLDVDSRVCPNCSDMLIEDASLLGSGDDEPFDRWGSRKTADYASTLDSLMRLDGAQVRLTFTGDGGVDSCSGALSIRDGSAIVTGAGGQVHSIPAHNVLGVQPIGYSTESIPVGGHAPGVMDMAMEWLMSGHPMGVSGVRQAAVFDGGWTEEANGEVWSYELEGVGEGTVRMELSGNPLDHTGNWDWEAFTYDSLPSRSGGVESSLESAKEEVEAMVRRGQGTLGARKTANPYAPENNPYLTDGPGTPSDGFKAPKDDPDGAVQLDREQNEPATTRPRVMPQGDPTSLLPDPNKEAYPLDEVAGPIVDTEPPASRAASVAAAEAAVLTPSLAVHIDAKVRQIVADIAANEPEVTTVDAVQRAVAILGHYPGMVRVAHPVKGEAVPDMQQALDDYLHHFLEQHGIAHA